MGVYLEAIKRPFSNIYKFILGSLLNILPIINFFSLGYVYESAKSALKGKKDLPEWGSWLSLFIKGFFIFLIGVIWMIPFSILSAIAFAKAMISFELVGGELTSFAKASPLAILSLIILIITIYLLPLAIMGYAYTGKFSSAFYLGNIIINALSVKYLVAWLVSIIIFIIYLTIGNIIPYAEIILGPAAAFAGMITMFTIIARIYNK